MSMITSYVINPFHYSKTLQKSTLEPYWWIMALSESLFYSFRSNSFPYDFKGTLVFQQT